ncbi:T-box transcription factor TBX22-like [Hemiscyllium ocellatum]|uniref:T-box transcription factor TBX22-like n=1 Tax=Hemiscyllium ocellatum TaxID=170820 RepID=UPI002967097A|nr:T-box transcription factor TBX22-like [Hemiscyllium ocellatum]
MALSSRAHAFSVESLVGNPLKRKLEDGEDGKARERPGGTLKQAQSSKQRDEQRAGEASKTRSGPGPTSPGGDSEGLHLELQGSELWKRFHEIGTEMIITKAGRRMFPAVRVKIKGLEPAKLYYIAMDIIPVDSKRYRYVYHSSQWMVAGNTEQSPLTPRLYMHPDSPASGESWMKQIVSFDRVKLTNNDMDEKGHIILQSMHKYRPRIHVILKEADEHVSVNQILPPHGVRTFAFPETEFTTVTAYQNQQITRLKIDRNPFAKGFRDPGRNRVNLERVMDNYPWRTVDCRPKLDFPTFNIQKQIYQSSRDQNECPPSASLLMPHLALFLCCVFVLFYSVSCSDSRLGVSCGVGPVPLASVFSPTCSFHMSPASLGMSCRESPLCGVDGPLCYKLAPAPPQALAWPLYDRLRGSGSGDLLAAPSPPPLMFRLPAFLCGGKGADCSSGGGGSQLPLAGQPPGAVSPQGVYAPRRPYTLHGYTPPTLTAGPLKAAARDTAASPGDGLLAARRGLRGAALSQWPQTVEHSL